MSDIEKIKQEVRAESNGWYVWDRAGDHRYQITRNYGNSVERFIEEIKRLKPAVEETGLDDFTPRP